MKVVVYSHDADTRADIKLAIGSRPAADLPEVEIVEVATAPALFRLLDLPNAGGVDVMVLDGEAQPAGGMGVSRQAKDEIYQCPPVLLIIARADDRWLATWSRADAVISHPIDQVALARELAGLMRPRAIKALSHFPNDTSARPGSDPVAPLPLNLLARRPPMDTPTWPALIRTLINGQALTAEQAAWAMNEIMEGAASPARIAAFGVALRAKGETVDEMAGLASAMLAHATPISVPGPVTDLVGTGGDGAHTVNVSTMATIVAAACGVRIAKHGNRAASSACGAADVLEALGVIIDLPPSATTRLAREIGVAFLFAPLYHPGFRHTAPVRSELGVPTAFNFLGPLTNPTRPSSVAAGVADPRMGGVLAEVFAARGNSALVFHGGGLDELTTTGPSLVWIVANGMVALTEFDPLSVGLPRASLEDLRGGDATRNATVVRTVLAGQPGPVRDIVVLNAAAAIAASEGLGAVVDGYADATASGTTPEQAKAAVAEGFRKVLEAGIARAAEAIDSGAAAQLLARWAEASHRLAIPGPR